MWIYRDTFLTRPTECISYAPINKGNNAYTYFFQTVVEGVSRMRLFSGDPEWGMARTTTMSFRASDEWVGHVGGPAGLWTRSGILINSLLKGSWQWALEERRSQNPVTIVKREWHLSIPCRLIRRLTPSKARSKVLTNATQIKARCTHQGRWNMRHPIP